MSATATAPAPTFDWHVPTRVLYGAGRLADLGALAAGLGARPLVVTDGGLAGSPILAQARRVLAAHCGPVAVSARVLPEPTLGVVLEVVDDLRSAGATVVAGVGGGSVMDVAKAAALLAADPALRTDPRWGREGAIFVDDAAGPALPLVQVPTTVATGSEVNAVASITHGGRKRLLVGPPLYARAALVDPELTGSLPGELLLSGGLESIGRALCPFLAGEGTAVGDEIAMGLLRATVAAMDRVAAGDADLDTRATLACAATIGMTQLSNVGRDRWGHVLWYLQNSVGRCLSVPKGIAMAALLPAYLADIASQERLGPRCGSPARLARFGRDIWGASASAVAGAAFAVDQVAAALRRWRLPGTLAALEPGLDQLSEIIDETVTLWTGAGRLRGVSRTQVEAFYTAALAGPG